MKRFLVTSLCLVTWLVSAAVATGEILLDWDSRFSVTPGEEFIITLTMTNYGESVGSSDVSYLDISFEDDPSIEVIGTSSGFSGNTTMFTPGDPIFHRDPLHDPNPFPAEDYLISATKAGSWPSGYSEWIKLRVSYQELGNHSVQYRGTMGQTISPASSSFTDQQGWPATREIIRVKVNEPPTISSPVVTPDSGHVGTDFTFRVSYADENQDPPYFIRLVIDGNDYPMTPVDPDTPWDSRYQVTVSGQDIGEGSDHTFQFQCSDGAFVQATPMQNGPVVGPPTYDIRSNYFKVPYHQVLPGEEITVTGRIENHGNIATRVRYKVFFQPNLNDSSNYTSRSIDVGESVSGLIDPGDYENYSIDVTVPESFLSGNDYFVAVNLDPQDEYPEDNESDNNGFNYITISYTWRHFMQGLQQLLGAYSGDPVNTALGNFTHESQDLYLPGIGLDLNFTRTYNSQAGIDSPIGMYWNHSYNMYLVEERISVPGYNDDQSFKSGNIIVVYGDGRQHLYTENGTKPPPGVFASLEKQGDGSYVLTEKNKVRYTFGPDLKLASIADRNNNTITLTYSGGKLTQLVDTAGRVVTLAYDTFGDRQRILSISGPGRNGVSYDYDNAGNLISVTDPNGNVTEYTYVNGHRDRHLLRTIKNGRGIVELRNYYGDADGTENDTGYYVVRQQDGLSMSTSYTYDLARKVTTITDPEGLKTYHYYDSRYQFIKEVDPDGGQLTYTYSNGLRTSVVNKRGYRTSFTYDDRGNMTRRVAPNGTVEDFLYNPDDTLQEKSKQHQAHSELSQSWSYEYDSRGNLTKVIDPLSNVTTYGYYPNGLLQETTDPKNNKTQYAYDQYGNPSTVTDAEGGVIVYQYDDAGRKISEDDSSNLPTRYTYDDNDNLLSITDGSGLQQFTYDENDNKLSTTNRRNYTTSHTYDAKDRLIKTTDPSGRTTEYTYTVNDQRQSITDNWQNTTSFTYNSTGQQLTRLTPDGSLYRSEYDPSGNRIALIDPTGARWEYEYDEGNRLLQERDPEGNVTRREYDPFGRLTVTTDGRGLQTVREYDKLDRLIAVTDSNGGSSIFTYDANGNRVGEQDARGNVVEYQYDNINRLIKIVDRNQQATTFNWGSGLNRNIMLAKTDGESVITSYSLYPDRRLVQSVSYSNGEPSVSLVHDENANIIAMTDGTGTTSYQYDESDRLESVTDPFGNTVGYRYDDINHTKTLIYPDLKEVHYGFDNMSRLATVVDWLGNTTSYSYNSRGLTAQASSSTGTLLDYGYDSAGRLRASSSKASGNKMVATYTLDLDAVGNRQAIDADTPVTPFHLLSLPGTVLQQASASYDQENQLETWDANTFTYDNEGRLSTISGGPTTELYSFNASNLLTDYNDSVIARQNLYDGAGIRLQTTVNETATRFVLDRSGAMPNVICEQNDSGDITAYYIHGAGLLAQILPDGTRYDYHFDPSGSTVAMTDSTGEVVNGYAYGPYGRIINSEIAVNNPFTFIGQYGVMDEGNDLYFMRARYYDAETKRFLSRDPLKGKDEETFGMNPYLYAGANPIIFIDPNGLTPSESDCNLDCVADITLAAESGMSAVHHAAQIGSTGASTGGSAVFTGVSNTLVIAGLALAGKDIVVGILEGYAHTDYNQPGVFTGGYTVGYTVGAFLRMYHNLLLYGDTYSYSSSDFKWRKSYGLIDLLNDEQQQAFMSIMDSNTQGAEQVFDSGAWEVLRDPITHLVEAIMSIDVNLAAKSYASSAPYATQYAY